MNSNADRWSEVATDRRGRKLFNLPPELGELMVLLDKEGDLLKQLREVMRQVREAVVHQEMDRLQKAVGLENEIVDRAAELSRIEREKLAIVAPHFATSAERIATLDDLIQNLPEPVAKTCRFLSEKIRTIAGEIAALNRVNETVLRAALAFVADSIDLLRGAACGPEYGRPGTPRSRNADAALLDRVG